jgi:NhaP-type Na+/H+ or K+/H+ antiporter
MLGDLKLVNGVAIGLIALAAGGELNFRRLRPRLRSILAIGSIGITVSVIVLTVSVFLFARFLPFMAGFTSVEKGVIALSMAVVLSALSPTVTLALIEETGAAGPVSETLLGLVVMADLVIVLAFAGVNSLANATFGGAAEGAGRELMIHIFGSIAAGVVIGGLLAIYLKRYARRIALFVFGVCFLAAEAGTRLHLDPLLICLTAGLFLENLTDIEGSKLVHDIESASLPVFAVFFAVAGAGLHWEIFKHVAPIAIALAVVRAVTYFGAAQIGMSVGRVEKPLRKFIPYGMLSQSGVAIGLVVLLATHFPSWGAGASACVLGTVMVNEMIGPILFRSALVRSGETGKRAAVAVSH